MIQSAVVDDLVHNEFDAFFPGFTAQFPIFLQRPEAGIHFIEIRDGVAVVRSLRHIVGQHRAGPERGESHIDYITGVETCECFSLPLPRIQGIGYFQRLGARPCQTDHHGSRSGILPDVQIQKKIVGALAWMPGIQRDTWILDFWG